MLERISRREWLTLSAPLMSARVAAILHAAAFAFALGAIASLYLRGIVFDYRAGWESTFLAAGEVHRILALVLLVLAKLAFGRRGVARLTPN